MKRVVLFLLAAFSAAVVLPAGTAQAVTIVYIDQNCTGPEHDGTSWAKAYTTIEAALALDPAGREFHVAKGTYGRLFRKDASGRIAYVLGPWYGGYMGAQGLSTNTADIRNFLSTPTVLDGQNLSDTANIPGTVVYGPELLDGFTVKNGTGHAFVPGDRTYGGGIYGIINSVISNCTVTGNSADNGGGIAYWDAGVGDNLAKVSCCVIENNTAGIGGGIYANDMDARLFSNIIRNNHAGSYGGGIYYGSSPYATVIKNRIVDNFSALGGGMYLNSSPAVISNNLMSGNGASVGAGAIACQGFAMIDIYGVKCYPAIVDNTFFNNNAPFGGAIGLVFGGSSPDITNNIFAWNSSGISGDAAAGDAPKVLNNDFWMNSEYPINPGFAPVQAGNITTDPLFVNIAAGNFHILPGSYCINAGTVPDPNYSARMSFPDPGNTILDCDNQSRPANSFFDLGIDEVADTVSPFVAQTIPLAGATGVSKTAPIKVVYSENMRAGASTLGIKVTYVVSGKVKEFRMNKAFPGPSNPGTTLTLTPVGTMPGSTTFTVTVPSTTMRDVAFNSPPALTFTFKTAK